MFYIIEKQDQLNKLELFGDCFISFIRESDNFHPKLSSLSFLLMGMELNGVIKAFPGNRYSLC